MSINDTYALIYYYYHLINEVWPSVSSFGEVKLSQIIQYLNAILISYIEYQWHNAYNDASLISSDNPKKQLILKYIYNIPTYYDGYYLCSIEVNLIYRGSTAGEKIILLQLYMLVKVIVRQ